MERRSNSGTRVFGPRRRWRVLALVAATIGGGVVASIAGPVRTAASPFDLTPSNDPRIPANCPAGYGSDGNGGTIWCRVHGIDVTIPPTGAFRWAGQYAFITDDGSGPKVSYGWCLDDSGTHPRVAYALADLTDGKTLAEALHGPLAHPEGADVIPRLMGLINDGQSIPRNIPGYSTTYTPDELSAGVWAVQHYVVGDRTASGVVVVSDLTNWASSATASTPARLAQLTQEMWAYGLAHIGQVFTVDHGPVSFAGDVAFTVHADANGGPYAADEMYVHIDWATNLEWATSGLPFTGPLAPEPLLAPPPDTTFGNGVVTLNLRLIDPTLPGTLHASKFFTTPSSWRGFLAAAGEQSTGVYFSPADIVIDAEATALPAGRFVRVTKTSSDPAFAVQGAQFQLVDGGGAGAVLASATTNANGIADFPMIDPGAMTPPLVVRETVAPAGLAPAADVVVPMPLSVDVAAPTTVAVADTPVTRDMRIHKTLSDPSAGPGDLSGFTWSVVRSDGRQFGTYTSDASGFSPTFSVVAGTYHICETAAPTWWLSALGPCNTVAVDLGATTTVEVDYLNVVGAVSCATQLRDGDDGDELLPEAGGTVVDSVTCTGLVPQTTYTLSGELQRRHPDGTVSPSGLAGTATFTATADTHTVAVSFTIPPGYACAVFVAYETLSARGNTVAVHADAADEDQTVYLPAISTDASTASGGRVARPADAIVDHVSYCGLPAGSYTADAAWQRATSAAAPAAGGGAPQCADAALPASTTFVVTANAPNGFVDLPAVTVPSDGPGTFVAFETVRRSNGTKVAEHRDCADLHQTIWRPTLRTTAVERDAVGPGVNHDVIVVADLPPATVLADHVVSVAGALHRHDAASPIDQWSCDVTNQVATFTLAVSGNGTFTSPGEAHQPDLDYSYQEQLEITPSQPRPPAGPPDALTGTADGRWASAAHGCRVPTQTFHSRSPAPLPVPATPQRPLPQLGVSTLLLVSVAGCCLAGGTIVAAARRRRHVGR